MANPEHLEILKKGVKFWNKWRKDNPDIRPDLSEANLIQANLFKANLFKANLFQTNLSQANLSEANLSRANLFQVNLNRAYLFKANLSRANLIQSNFSRVNLVQANLFKANLIQVNLSRANLSRADLRKANLRQANLRGAELVKMKLQGACFNSAVVDGSTLVSDCEVDRKTDFELVGLGDMRIESGIRQLLEYNIRRNHWEKWYEQGNWLKCFVKKTIVRWFWQMSDYGKSTKRIIFSFIIFSGIFAVIYSNFACFCSPGIIENLYLDKHESLWHYGILLVVRPLYFSVVTMTTLGFGDIYAEKQSILGHILLGMQVLFTAGGPAARFKPMNEYRRNIAKEEDSS